MVNGGELLASAFATLLTLAPAPAHDRNLRVSKRMRTIASSEFRGHAVSVVLAEITA